MGWDRVATVGQVYHCACVSCVSYLAMGWEGPGAIWLILSL